MITVQTGTGDKASSIVVPVHQDGDKLMFTVSAKQLVELAKPSSTGASEGVMLKLTGRFAYDDEQAGPINVDLSCGRGGTGAWTSLKATKRMV